MKKIKGIPVSSGIAIGNVKIVIKEKLQIERKYIKQHEIESEMIRLESSIEHVLKELDVLIDDIASSQDNKDILSTHKMILQDPELFKKITFLIKEELLSMEHAIQQHFTEVVDLFSNMENEYYSERSSDYEDVAYRLLSHVLDQRKDILSGLNENSILIMENISPSGVARVFEKKVKGVCIERGSKNSHSSIIARSLNLPFVARVNDILKSIKEDDFIILDGTLGEIIISPDKKTIEEYTKKLDIEKKDKEKLNKIKNLETKTSDGKKIALMSNIEIPEEINQVINNNSEGIGLFRTEFLFMDKIKLPGEDEQYEIYNSIAEKIFPFPLIIRTIDVGGDKISKILNIEHELNPNLGCRGIRISLEHIPIFKIQVRAILRASKRGNVKIMFPMISSCYEIVRVKSIIEECKEELRKKNISFDENIKIGAMIEIPSAAITSDTIAQECDFLSIGTNDLIQYTLAADRDNQSIEKYYLPHHPSIIKLIKMTVQNAHEKGIKVAICGEMASQPEFVPLLLGLGIDELSVSPGLLLKIKDIILHCDMRKNLKLTENILQQKTHKDIEKILKEKKG